MYFGRSDLIFFLASELEGAIVSGVSDMEKSCWHLMPSDLLANFQCLKALGCSSAKKMVARTV